MVAACVASVWVALGPQARRAVRFSLFVASIVRYADHLFAPPAGVNIRLQDNAGNSPLHYAVINSDDNAVIELLVRSQAPLNVQNCQGETPLFIAARQNDVAVVKFLLRSGANANVATVDEATPLHVAAANDNTAVVSALLESGAHVNARDSCLETPLHWAVREGHVAATQLLLGDYRCDRSARNEDGETARDLALANNLSELYAIMAPPQSPNRHGVNTAVDETGALPPPIAHDNNAAFSERLRAAGLAADRRTAQFGF